MADASCRYEEYEDIVAVISCPQLQLFDLIRQEIENSQELKQFAAKVAAG